MSLKVIVKKSKKENKGVFANQNFKKGEIIINIDYSKIVSKKNVMKLSKNNQNHTTYIGKDRYVIMKPPERFINHSCDPNVFVNRKNLIAIRNIKKGEEITCDYSINGIDPWIMKCNCGSKNCRKKVFGDFRKLGSKTKKKYLPYLEDWYKKEVLRL